MLLGGFKLDSAPMHFLLPEEEPGVDSPSIGFGLGVDIAARFFGDPHTGLGTGACAGLDTAARTELDAGTRSALLAILRLCGDARCLGSWASSPLWWSLSAWASAMATTAFGSGHWRLLIGLPVPRKPRLLIASMPFLGPDEAPFGGEGAAMAPMLASCGTHSR